MNKCICALASLACVLTTTMTHATAQERRGDLVGSLSYLATTYSGEFLRDGFGNGATLSLGYGLSNRLWVEGRLGLGQYSWQTNQTLMRKYDEYYGASSSFGASYPGSTALIESSNESAFRIADIMLGYTLTNGSTVRPFVTAGIGMVNFQPRTASAGDMLPNYERGTYAATAASVPVGLGVRFALSDAVQMSIRGEYRLVFSGYLDDFAVQGINDGLYGISAGISYAFSGPSTAPANAPYWCELCNVRYDASNCAICAAQSCPICAQQRQAALPANTEIAAPSVPEVAMTTLAANGTPVDQQLPPDESAKRPMMDEPASNAENNSAKPQEMKDIATPEAVKSAPRRRLTAPGIQFKADSEKINFDDPATRTNLNEILEFLRESCEELKVMIEGHASSEGPAIRNQQLSILRAREVAKWLFSQGVPAEKVQGAVGMGSSMPKIAEPSPSVAKRMSKEQLEAIREQNRRIELEILEDCK